MCTAEMQNKTQSSSGSLCLVDCVPELVPVLKLVELRTNVFGSEQKSLRAWQCRRVTGRVREGDRRKEGERIQQQERETDETKEGRWEKKTITREKLVDTLTD